jgi:hypothetical protein
MPWGAVRVRSSEPQARKVTQDGRPRDAGDEAIQPPRCPSARPLHVVLGVNVRFPSALADAAAIAIILTPNGRREAAENRHSDAAGSDGVGVKTAAYV